jgi:hypothetical protein
VKYALDNKRWWRPDHDLTTEAWKEHKHLLAPHLSYDAWTDVRLAALDLNEGNFLAAAPRPQDRTQEIFLQETETALFNLLESYERGRIALMPYLL